MPKIPKPDSKAFQAPKELQETIAKLQAALLILNKGSNRQLLKYLYNVDGYVKVTHSDYQSVERLAREYGFLKGN